MLPVEHSHRICIAERYGLQITDVTSCSCFGLVGRTWVSLLGWGVQLWVSIDRFYFSIYVCHFGDERLSSTARSNWPHPPTLGSPGVDRPLVRAQGSSQSRFQRDHFLISCEVRKGLVVRNYQFCFLQGCDQMLAREEPAREEWWPIGLSTIPP